MVQAIKYIFKEVYISFKLLMHIPSEKTTKNCLIRSLTIPNESLRPIDQNIDKAANSTKRKYQILVCCNNFSRDIFRLIIKDTIKSKNVDA